MGKGGEKACNKWHSTAAAMAAHTKNLLLQLLCQFKKGTNVNYQITMAFAFYT